MEALLQEVEGLPLPAQRIQRLVALGKASASDQHALATILQLGASSDAHHRSLALQACSAGGQSPQLADLACRIWEASSSIELRHQAAAVLVAIADDDRLLKVLKSLPLAHVKRCLKQLRKPRRGRQAVIDALVRDAADPRSGRPALLNASLPYASTPVVQQHWPDLEDEAEALEWGLLANYHPQYCIERVRQSADDDQEERLAAAMPWLATGAQEQALQLLQGLQPEQRTLSARLPNSKQQVAALGSKRKDAKRKGGHKQQRGKLKRLAKRRVRNKTQRPLSCALSRDPKRVAELLLEAQPKLPDEHSMLPSQAEGIDDTCRALASKRGVQSLSPFDNSLLRLLRKLDPDTQLRCCQLMGMPPELVLPALPVAQRAPLVQLHLERRQGADQLLQGVAQACEDRPWAAKLVAAVGQALAEGPSYNMEDVLLDQLLLMYRHTGAGRKVRLLPPDLALQVVRHALQRLPALEDVDYLQHRVVQHLVCVPETITPGGWAQLLQEQPWMLLKWQRSAWDNVSTRGVLPWQPSADSELPEVLLWIAEEQQVALVEVALQHWREQPWAVPPFDATSSGSAAAALKLSATSCKLLPRMSGSQLQSLQAALQPYAPAALLSHRLCPAALAVVYEDWHGRHWSAAQAVLDFAQGHKDEAGRALQREGRLVHELLSPWLQPLKLPGIDNSSIDSSGGGGSGSGSYVCIDLPAGSSAGSDADMAEAATEAAAAAAVAAPAAAEAHESALSLLPLEQLQQLLPLVMEHWEAVAGSAAPKDTQWGAGAAARLAHALKLLPQQRRLELCWQHWELVLQHLLDPQQGLAEGDTCLLLQRWLEQHAELRQRLLLLAKQQGPSEQLVLAKCRQLLQADPVVAHFGDVPLRMRERVYREIESLWHMGWIKLQPESLPTALRLQHAREQVARVRERMAAEAAPAIEALPLLRPWLLLLPWREVVELQEVAALLRHQQAGERERAMELLAQLAQRQPLHLPEYLQLLCARSREAEPVRQHLLGHLAALVEAASGSSAHCKELQRALAAAREQMGQLLAGHLAARDFSDASASLWHRLLARLLGLGLAWAPLLACPLAALHGLPSVGTMDKRWLEGVVEKATPAPLLAHQMAALHGLPSVGTMDKRWLEGVEECVAAVLQDVMQLPLQQRQQRPWQEREQEAVERVGELATALAALAAAVVQHQQGPQLVAQMAELSGFMLLPMIGRFTENTIEWQQQAPLFLAAKPALVGALRAAASAVALHGTSAEVYRKLEMEVTVWTDTTELQLLWGPELLAELLPVLLPPALLQLPMGERRGLEGREEAEQLGKLALKVLKPTLNDKSGGSGGARARVQELLVHCALQNPWLPRLAARAVFLLAAHFPGCLTAAASAGAQPGLLERLVAADVGFAALPSTFPLICRGRTDLLAPLLALQRLPASSLFDCRLLHQLYQQHRRPYCSRWLGSDCGDNLWVVLPPCWRGSLLSPQQQAELAATLVGTLRPQAAPLSVGHSRRLLRQLVRLPLLPAQQLLSLLEPAAPAASGGTEGQGEGQALALPEAVQELVMEALTRLDDQQQAWEVTLAALGSKSVGAGAVSAFGRILSGYARRAGSWDEVARLLAAVPMFKVAVAKEVIRVMVEAAERLQSAQARQELRAMWAQAQLHRSVRVVLVRELAQLAATPEAQEVLLAAAAHADVEVAQAACCLPPRAPGTPAFAAELLGALLVHADRSVRMGAMQLLGGDGPGLLELHEGLPLVDQLLGRARALEQQHEQQQQQQQRQQSGRAAAGSSPEAAEAAKARAAAAEFLSGVASRQQPLDEFA